MRRVAIGGLVLVLVLDACSRPAAPRPRRDPTQDPREGDVQRDVGAQFEVGVRIVNGPGDPPDFAEAATWFRRAAEQGHPGAQAALGVMFHRGRGVPRDDREALKWLELAASQPSAEREAYEVWRDAIRESAAEVR